MSSLMHWHTQHICRLPPVSQVWDLCCHRGCLTVTYRKGIMVQKVLEQGVPEKSILCKLCAVKVLPRFSGSGQTYCQSSQELEKWYSEQNQNGIKHECFLFFDNLLDEILLIIVLMVISLSTNEVGHFSMCLLVSYFFIVKCLSIFWYLVFI